MEAVVVEARGLLGRMRGLIGRPGWPAGVALRLAPCRSVHTYGMRFAVDLVWLDGDGRIVLVDRGVRPWRVRTCLAARAVLELRAGSDLGAIVEPGGLVAGGWRGVVAAGERRH